MVRGIPILMCVRDVILDVYSYMKNHVVQSATQSIFTLFIEKANDSSDVTSSFAERLAQSGANTQSDETVLRYERGFGVDRVRMQET